MHEQLRNTIEKYQLLTKTLISATHERLKLSPEYLLQQHQGYIHEAYIRIKQKIQSYPEENLENWNTYKLHLSEWINYEEKLREIATFKIPKHHNIITATVPLTKAKQETFKIISLAINDNEEQLINFNNVISRKEQKLLGHIILKHQELNPHSIENNSLSIKLAKIWTQQSYQLKPGEEIILETTIKRLDLLDYEIGFVTKSPQKIAMLNSYNLLITDSEHNVNTTFAILQKITEFLPDLCFAIYETQTGSRVIELNNQKWENDRSIAIAILKLLLSNNINTYFSTGIFRMPLDSIPLQLCSTTPIALAQYRGIVGNYQETPIGNFIKNYHDNECCREGYGSFT